MLWLVSDKVWEWEWGLERGRGVLLLRFFMSPFVSSDKQ